MRASCCNSQRRVREADAGAHGLSSLHQPQLDFQQLRIRKIRHRRRKVSHRVAHEPAGMATSVVQHCSARPPGPHLRRNGGDMPSRTSANIACVLASKRLLAVSSRMVLTSWARLSSSSTTRGVSGRLLSISEHSFNPRIESRSVAPRLHEKHPSRLRLPATPPQREQRAPGQPYEFSAWCEVRPAPLLEPHHPPQLKP